MLDSRGKTIILAKIPTITYTTNLWGYAVATVLLGLHCWGYAAGAAAVGAVLLGLLNLQLHIAWFSVAAMPQATPPQACSLVVGGMW